LKIIFPNSIKIDELKKKPTVLVIASLGNPPYLGGIENVVDTLVKSSLKCHYNFIIIDTYRIPNRSRPLIHKVLFAFKIVFFCRKYFLVIKPDIVHIHFCSHIDFFKHSICLFVAKTFGFKTIFHLHGGSFAYIYSNYPVIIQKFVKYIFRLPDYVIALSHYWAKFISSFTNGDHIKILHNPIDCNKFEIQTNERLSDNIPKRILLLGRIGRHKGHYEAIKSLPYILNHFPDVMMLFAGKEDGHGEIYKLTQLANNLGVSSQVEFLGPVTGPSKIHLLKNVDIMILPSYGENMPLSIMEGMAAKIPIVASNVGAIPEMLENGKLGILIHPGNPIVLAESINKLFYNSSMAHSFAASGHKKARALYDIEKIAIQLDKLYKEVITE